MNRLGVKGKCIKEIKKNKVYEYSQIELNYQYIKDNIFPHCENEYIELKDKDLTKKAENFIKFIENNGLVSQFYTVDGQQNLLRHKRKTIRGILEFVSNPTYAKHEHHRQNSLPVVLFAA